MDRPRAKPIPPPIKGNVQKARLDNSSNFASLESTSTHSRKILRGFSSKSKFEISPTITNDSFRLDTIVPSFVKISHRQLRNRKFLSQNFLLRTKAGKFSQREESHVFTEGVPLLSEERRNSEQSYGQVHMYTLSYITHIYIYIRNGLKIQVAQRHRAAVAAYRRCRIPDEWITSKRKVRKRERHESSDSSLGKR